MTSDKEYDKILFMPIIKSAIKKVRKDKVRTEINRKKKAVIKTLLKKARIENNIENLKQIFSVLDKAVKTNLIHKNRASRLKSRLSKGISTAATPTKKASKKKS